ncbi:serine hydrolase domain-containing protein [Dactylosporangium sp. CA-233914]|uniref:serine hydrolase domain-containing protein n=1 Tax=Dactylosporangium sp. CA-233914 TaxID=3239934 RepID=UPI003D94966C
MTSPAEGHTSPEFEPVRQAFEALLRDDSGYSGQLAVYWRDRLVVDLTGGPELAPDSVIGVHSATKGVAALCLALLVQRGQLDLDKPVCHYWPEFGRHGKQDISVRQLLSHQAGLLGTADGLSTEDFCSRRAAELLADERPVWRPGSGFGYHRRTIGALMEELTLRATGRTLQELYAAEIRDPREVDFYLGLPASEEHRFVPTRYAPAPHVMPPAGHPGSLWALALGKEDRIPPNIERLRRYGPVANGGVGSARGLARAYACATEDVGGERLLTPQTVATFAQQQVFGTCLVTQRRSGYGIVFERPHPDDAYASFQALGHRGANGSLGYADPMFRVAVGFVRQPGVVGGMAPEVRTLTTLIRECAIAAEAGASS